MNPRCRRRPKGHRSPGSLVSCLVFLFLLRAPLAQGRLPLSVEEALERALAADAASSAAQMSRLPELSRTQLVPLGGLLSARMDQTRAPAELELIDAENALSLASADLAVRIGEDPENHIIPVSEPPLDVLVARGLGERPDLLAERLRLDAQVDLLEARLTLTSPVVGRELAWLEVMYASATEI